MYDEKNEELETLLMQLEEDFNVAAENIAVATVSGVKLVDEDMLKIYALYKQATCGPCNLSKPSLLNFKAKSKSAWCKLKAMSREEAMVEYIKFAKIVLAKTPDFKKGEANTEYLGGQIMSSYFENDLDEHAPVESSIHIRAGLGDMTGVKLILETSPSDVNLRDNEGCTALHWASDKSQLAMISFLLNENANVNAQNFDGQTPLHYAALTNQTEAYKLLLAHGADPDVKDYDGELAFIS